MREFDFQYKGVEITYSRSGCTCRDKDDYCRCTTIINEKIEKVDVEGILSNLPMLKNSKGKPLKLHTLDIYCVDRLLRYYKIYDKDLWEISVVGGYYGQEIGSVFFKEQKDLFSDIETLLKMNSNRNKMEFVLDREYGYILEVLEDKTWEIIEIEKSSIVQKQDTYYRKIDKCDYYKDWSLPICVVLQIEDGKYRLIDGYHRLAMNSNDSIEVILAR